MSVSLSFKVAGLSTAFVLIIGLLIAKFMAKRQFHVIASTVVAFPLMYQSAKTGFQSVDAGIEDAARIDGADEWKVFLFVTLPLSFRAILTGVILSFARALGEFGATFMFAGNIPGKTQTTSTAIYVAFDSGNMKMAWLLVGAMIVILFSCFYVPHF